MEKLPSIKRMQQLYTLSEKMQDLAVSLAEKAAAEKNLTTTAKFLEVIERSLNICDRAKSISRSISADQSAAAFFELWEPRRIPRPELWVEYLQFCLENHAEPQKKSIFFAYLDSQPCQVKLLTGVLTVIPTGYRSTRK